MRTQASKPTRARSPLLSDTLPDKPKPFEPVIDVTKALQLRLQHGLSYRDIACQLKCSKSGVHDALKKIDHIIDDPELTKAFRVSKADLVEAVQLKYLAHMSDETTIKAASANNAAYALGQLNNIIRLDRDQSTSNAAIKAEISFLSPGDEVPENNAELTFGGVNADDTP